MLKKFTIYYLPVIIWALIIFLFSANPQIKTSEIYWQDFILKKAAHIGEYAVLSLFLYRALVNDGLKKAEVWFYVVLICILYAFSDEYHQLFVEGRTGILRDVVFDTFGAAISIIFILKFYPSLPLKVRKIINI